MSLFNGFLDLFKTNTIKKPWLSYYSRKERKIKFTNKSIYNYLYSNVSDSLEYNAINYFGNRITYNDFFKEIDKVSKSLIYLNVKKGDIVTICMPNTPQALATFYACNKIGAVSDMIHPLSASNEIKNYLLESKSKILFLYDDCYEKIIDIIDDTYVEKTVLLSVKDSMPKLLKLGYTLTQDFKIIKPSKKDDNYLRWTDFISLSYKVNETINVKVMPKDLAVILHSGGTTGTPKGIMISNYSFNALAQQGGVAVFNSRPKDKILTILPIFHGFGLCVCCHCPLTLKIELILMPQFDNKRFYNNIQKYHPNIIAGVPTIFDAMVTNDLYKDVDFSNLKYMISGGDYLTVKMEDRINDFLKKHKASISISKGYGMTECVAAAAYTFEGTNEKGSIGIPMVGNEFCICNPNSTKKLPFDTEGEICITGPTIMMGYLNDKNETRNVLKKHSDGKIWLHTGDLGYINKNGIIYFTQRLKRMIVSSGFNVYPSIIEQVILKNSNVKSCCVIGVPHKYKVQVAKAFIILNDKVDDSFKTLSSIKKTCRDNLAEYSVPKYFEFMQSFPKTIMGKVDYKKLELIEKEKYEKKLSEENNNE